MHDLKTLKELNSGKRSINRSVSIEAPLKPKRKPKARKTRKSGAYMSLNPKGADAVLVLGGSNGFGHRA